MAQITAFIRGTHRDSAHMLQCNRRSKILSKAVPTKVTLFHKLLCRSGGQNVSHERKTHLNLYSYLNMLWSRPTSTSLIQPASAQERHNREHLGRCALGMVVSQLGNEQRETNEEPDILDAAVDRGSLFDGHNQLTHQLQYREQVGQIIA